MGIEKTKKRKGKAYYHKENVLFNENVVIFGKIVNQENIIYQLNPGVHIIHFYVKNNFYYN